MNPALIHEIETIFQEAPAPARLKCERHLAVAAGMLSAAAAHEMTATTVVGVLGSDDLDAFRALVADISEEYGLEATVKIHVGSYSVRFSRRVDAASLSKLQTDTRVGTRLLKDIVKRTVLTLKVLLHNTH